MNKWKWIWLGATLLVLPILSTRSEELPEFVWKQSLQVRSGDPTITQIGGTEVRALVTFEKKLFAAIGYWMDTEKHLPALPGAQVLRLDSADSEWQVDLELEERVPGQQLRLYQAISNLDKVRFTTDDSGHQLPQPVEFLLAGAWKRGAGLDVFSRASGSGPQRWSRMPIPGQEEAHRGTQARAFVLHKDRVTGVDMVFAGVTNAIFAGAYNTAQQKIVWSASAEWKGEHVGKPAATGRVSSFVEANGKLYAAVYGTIYERVDGSSPAWKKVFETAINSPRVTGLRGLTAMPNPSGPGEVLLASVEDNPSRIYRIDPQDVDASGMYKSTLELDVSAFLTRTLSTRVTYTGIAYNNTTEYPDLARLCSRRFIGLEAITRDGAQTFGQQRFNSNAYYLLRDCNGQYVLREIRDYQIDPKPDLVAVRAVALSPFSSDPVGTVYAGGFDANRNPVHNTAWLYKGTPAQAPR